MPQVVTKKQEKQPEWAITALYRVRGVISSSVTEVEPGDMNRVHNLSFPVSLLYLN